MSTAQSVSVTEAGDMTTDLYELDSWTNVT